MPLGIRPINDMAFKKTFGTPENKRCLISLLNAIMCLKESDLKTASVLDCWLFLLLHAHEYEPEELLKLFPDEVFQWATRTITQISLKTEDKAMYDAREKALRDYQSAISAALLEGEEKGRAEGEQRG